MFEGLKRKIKIQVLKMGLKRKAPEQFSYSSKTNFFVSFLKNISTDQEIMLDEIDKISFRGMASNGVIFDLPVSFPIEKLDSWCLKTTRFYGYNKIEYAGLRDFLLSELTFFPQRLYFKDWAYQKIYNYRTRFRQDRTDVLRKLIEIHLSEAKKNNGILFIGSFKSIVGLFAEFHGNRVYGHPNLEEVSARFWLVLESLVATGELEQNSMHEFKLSGLAVASISNFELEERRHNDSVKQNRYLLLLTVVMAIAAVFQSIAAFKK